MILMDSKFFLQLLIPYFFVCAMQIFWAIPIAISDIEEDSLDPLRVWLFFISGQCFSYIW